MRNRFFKTFKYVSHQGPLRSNSMFWVAYFLDTKQSMTVLLWVLFRDCSYYQNDEVLVIFTYFSKLCILELLLWASQMLMPLPVSHKCVCKDKKQNTVWLFIISVMVQNHQISVMVWAAGAKTDLKQTAINLVIWSSVSSFSKRNIRSHSSRLTDYT